jgi:hypothetical protein
VASKLQWFAPHAKRWISILHISAPKTVSKRLGPFINSSTFPDNKLRKKEMKASSSQDLLDQELYPSEGKSPSTSSSLIITTLLFPRKSRSPSGKSRTKSNLLRTSRK